MPSGKSKGGKGGNSGVRRKVDGKELAPRSLRKKGKRLLEECTPEELEAAGV